jgi:hypothetical protein
MFIQISMETTFIKMYKTQAALFCMEVIDTSMQKWNSLQELISNRLSNAYLKP